MDMLEETNPYERDTSCIKTKNALYDLNCVTKIMKLSQAKSFQQIRNYI